MVRYCAVCGNRIKLFPVKIKDDVICGPCGNRLPQVYYNIKETLDGEQLRIIIKTVEDNDNARPDMIQQALDTYRSSRAQEKPSEDKYEAVRRYKQLLDEGIITEEEFERKKKELLDL